MPTDTLETRMAYLEGAYEQIDKRLGTVEQRLTLVETKIDGLRQDIDRRFERVDQRFDKLRQGMDQRFERVDRRFDEQQRETAVRFERLEHSLRAQFYWLVGLLLSLLTLGLFRH